MLRLVLIAGVAGALATAAAAQPAPEMSTPEPTTNAASTADAHANDPNKVICKNVKPPTGTRIGSARNRQRICQTRADWEQQEADAQAAAANARNRGTDNKEFLGGAGTPGG